MIIIVELYYTLQLVDDKIIVKDLKISRISCNLLSLNLVEFEYRYIVISD